MEMPTQTNMCSCQLILLILLECGIGTFLAHIFPLATGKIIILKPVKVYIVGVFQNFTLPHGSLWIPSPFLLFLIIPRSPGLVLYFPGPVLVHSYIIPTPFLHHSCSIPTSFLLHSWLIPTSFLVHSWLIPTSLLVYSHIICSPFLGHSHIIPGSFLVHSHIIPNLEQSIVSYIILITFLAHLSLSLWQ